MEVPICTMYLDDQPVHHFLTQSEIVHFPDVLKVWTHCTAEQFVRGVVHVHVAHDTTSEAYRRLAGTVLFRHLDRTCTLPFVSDHVRVGDGQVVCTTRLYVSQWDDDEAKWALALTECHCNLSNVTFRTITRDASSYVSIPHAELSYLSDLVRASLVQSYMCKQNVNVSYTTHPQSTVTKRSFLIPASLFTLNPQSDFPDKHIIVHVKEGNVYFDYASLAMREFAGIPSHVQAGSLLTDVISHFHTAAVVNRLKYEIFPKVTTLGTGASCEYVLDFCVADNVVPLRTVFVACSYGFVMCLMYRT